MEERNLQQETGLNLCYKYESTWKKDLEINVSKTQLLHLWPGITSQECESVFHLSDFPGNIYALFCYICKCMSACNIQCAQHLQVIYILYWIALPFIPAQDWFFSLVQFLSWSFLPCHSFRENCRCYKSCWQQELFI